MDVGNWREQERKPLVIGEIARYYLQFSPQIRLFCPTWTRGKDKTQEQFYLSQQKLIQT
ncbi:MAG: hypothetical protein ACJA0C_001185 [Candidatus Endobugula sp.]|jgi:hypothetical protein